MGFLVKACLVFNLGIRLGGGTGYLLYLEDKAAFRKCLITVLLQNL